MLRRTSKGGSNREAAVASNTSMAPFSTTTSKVASSYGNESMSPTS
eukprot:CAMPEP_0206142506 /NCGR_PEP_ID=MMETSP1473-20131121/17172_1 /ASSEMBLY_ACC=CAM_ASM_001109 /TAXON_ID=1461547 /ORGANISM="Stichococcus sp, Strain RCC1054" /LENGTH=45 /DNA_ID= /DNA_START= /DNA_END= /DNA_ORIENTATION=